MSKETMLLNFTNSLLTWENKEVKTRDVKFRCSALPICPLSWVMTKLVNEGKSEEKENFSSLWFPAIGTIAHSALQRIGGDLNLLYGDWSKTITKYKIIEGTQYSANKKIFKKSSLKPTEEGTWLYEELVVREPTTQLSGHVDGLLKYKDGFIVLDFKTSSLEKNASLEEPPTGYYAQIQAYAYLLSKYGPYDEDTKKFRAPLKIYGTAILMMARDNPFNKENGIKIFFNEGFDEQVTIDNLKKYQMAEKSLQTGEFKEVVKHRSCRCLEDTLNCQYSVLGCGSGDPKKIYKNLKSIYEEM